METPLPVCAGNGLNDSCLFPNSSINSTLASDVNSSTTAPAAAANENFMLHVYANLPLQIIFGFASSVANLFTLLALSKIQARFHPYLLLVVNLTISDMVFGIRTVLFRSLWFVFQFRSDVHQWFLPDNDPGCARGLVRVMGSFAYTCTYINLVAMAFDLYFAILKPFSYSKLVTRKRTIIMCVFFWILALLMALANYIVAFFHFLGKFKEHSYCEVRSWHTSVDIYLYVVLIYIGIVVMTYLYIRIFIEVRRCARYTPGLPAKQVQAVKRKKRKVITSLLVLFTFLIGWLPNGIMTTLFFFKPIKNPAIATVGLYFAGLPMMNSICDPVIYAVRLDKVRIGFKRLCGKKQSAFDYCASEVTEQVSLSTKSSHRESRPSVTVDNNEYLIVKPTNGSALNGNGVHAK